MSGASDWPTASLGNTGPVESVPARATARQDTTQISAYFVVIVGQRER